MAEDPVFHIYCDESSQGAHHYMAIGATFCRRDAAQEIAEALTACVVKHGGRPDKELRWNDLTRQTLPMYMDAASTFIGFTKHRNRKLRYRCLVVDNHKIDHGLSGGDRDVTLAKFIFTLVYGFAKSFGAKIQYAVFLDERSSTSSVDRTFYSLNNKAKAISKLEVGPFKSVRFVKSQSSRLIQGTDLITGAIAYETNERHKRPEAAQHRNDLMLHVAKCAGLTTLARPTSKWPFNFQIGHFDFEKSRLK